jgi:hypothetical protein
MFLDEPTTGLDPRSRNQVWEIVRALVAEGTTVLLCTQYLEEADQLADGIAVIDRGRSSPRARPAQLKASVGTGALHVRLLDPAQRAGGRAAAGGELGARPRARPGRAVGAASDAERARAPSASWRRGRRHRALLARPAQPRRGLPGPHRPRRRDRPPSTPAPEEQRHDRHAEATRTRRAAVRPPRHLSTPRPPASGDVRGSLRVAGMLKVKHVPEQLLDVTITPVMFVLMFTYLFGGAVAGSTERLPRLHPARHPGHVGAVHDRLLRRRAQHRPTKGRGRPVPLAADLAAVTAARLAARRQRALRRRGTVIIVLGIVLGYRPGGGVPGVLARWRSSWSSRSGCRGCSRCSVCSCARPTRS